MLGDTGTSAAAGRFTGVLTQNTTQTQANNGGTGAGSSTAVSNGGGPSAAQTATVSATATATAATSSISTGTNTETPTGVCVGIAGPSAPTASPELPIRLRIVSGYQNRVNDIVYLPPFVRHDEEPTAVVYFGGDVQDFVENMETNRDSKSYMKYNLEATSQLLRQGFPKAHVIVVRPARMEFKTFSCFDNFVRGNNAGVPDHTPMHNSLQHLEKLLHSTMQRLHSLHPTANAAGTNGCNSSNNHNPQSSQPHSDTQDMDIDILQVQETITVDANGTILFAEKAEGTLTSTAPDVGDADQSAELASSCTVAAAAAAVVAAAATATESTATASTSTAGAAETDAWWWLETLCLDKCKLILVGFSKGCVVLNQFIYEFHYLKTLTPDDLTMLRLLGRIRDMYWLDGGHGGAKNTWITSRSLLETLTRLAIQIHVHVTPYQVQDERRPWIRREEKTFVELLRRLGAPLQRCLHFDSAAANLYTHFEVLQVFRQACPPQPEAGTQSPTYDDDDDEK